MARFYEYDQAGGGDNCYYDASCYTHALPLLATTKARREANPRTQQIVFTKSQLRWRTPLIVYVGIASLAGSKDTPKRIPATILSARHAHLN